MKYVGAHVSIGGGVENAPLNAAKIGARAFAMFTKNERQWSAKPYTAENIAAFRENLAKAGLAPEHVLAHDSYLINLGNPDAGLSHRTPRTIIQGQPESYHLCLSMTSLI